MKHFPGCKKDYQDFYGYCVKCGNHLDIIPISRGGKEKTKESNQNRTNKPKESLK